MLEVTTRKIGNSIAISIPKKLNISAGTEFVAYKSLNGSLIFSPKIDNPFQSDFTFEGDKEDEWQDIAQREWESDV